MGLLAFRDCAFESRRGHEYLSLVGAVCCQVEVSATGRSHVQRSCIECVCVSLSVIVKPRHLEDPGPLGIQGEVFGIGVCNEPIQKSEKSDLRYFGHTFFLRKEKSATKKNLDRKAG